MANRVFQDTQAIGAETKFVVGSFLPKGTSAPVLATGVKGVTSVARTGVGDYTLTLDDEFPYLLSAIIGVRAANDTETSAQFGDYDSSAKTLTLHTFVSGTLADLADDADNTVNFILVFKNILSTVA